MNNRIDKLKSILEKDPGNVLTLYGLAMEYAKHSQFTDAIATFDSVLSHDPNYVAAYYHKGKTLEKMADTVSARDVYQKGISVAEAIGNMHALSELVEALDAIN